MNILILNWRGPNHPNAGGAEVATIEHAKYWVSQGHSVTYFTSSYTGAKETSIQDGIEFVRKGSQVFGVHIAAAWWYLVKKNKKFDVVIDQIHGIPFFTPLYVSQPKIAYIHEVAKEVWNLNPWPFPFNLIPRVIGGTLEPLLYKLIYRKTPFMTVSQSTKDDLHEWGIPKEQIAIVLNGATLLPTTRNKTKVPTVMYLGALSKDKGIEDALRVFSTIAQKHPSWQYWVVGKGDKKYVQYLESKAAEYGISEKVTFYGYVDQSKKFDLLSKGHVLINPSVREGWGLVNIEAASAGTVVVAYDVAGCRDSVRHNETGLLVGIGNIQSLADATISIIEDKKAFKKMSLAGVEWSKKFTWEQSGKESLMFIDSIISPN